MPDRPTLAGLHHCTEAIRQGLEAHHASYVSALAATEGAILTPARTIVCQTPGSMDDGRPRPPRTGWPIIYIDAAGHGPPTLERHGPDRLFRFEVQVAIEIWTLTRINDQYTAAELATQKLLAAVTAQLIDDPSCGSPDLTVSWRTINALLGEPWKHGEQGIGCRARLMFLAEWRTRLTRGPLIEAPIEPSTVTVELLED